MYVNDGFERTTGYDEDTALGRNCRFLQGPATDSDAVERLREHIAAHDPVTVDLVNYRADGTPFWNQVRVSPVENDAGAVTHQLGFQVDVTERKRTEQLVRLLNRVLRHNLRNDMNVFVGLGELLEAEFEGDAADMGRRIRTTAENLVDLSEQARELERYARRKRAPERLDTDALLESVVERQREEFPTATLDVTVRTERDLCAGAEVEAALAELVENAVEHNPSESPRVGVEADDDGEWVELTVTDDGPGIDEMEAAVVARGDETELEHGTGFGLWLVNWIVTRYGGSFQIRAAEAGTVATVRLPALDADTPVESVAHRPTVLFR